jgi:hypothetical protein
MLFLPIRDSIYRDARFEASESGECPIGTRVLAWVNYLSEYGIKRYYMIERGERGWFKLHVDVYPEDRTVFWNIASRDGFERDNYVDSYYMTDDGSVVIHIGDLQAYKDAGYTEVTKSEV